MTLPTARPPAWEAILITPPITQAAAWEAIFMMPPPTHAEVAKTTPAPRADRYFPTRRDRWVEDVVILSRPGQDSRGERR